jgi:transposase
MADFFWFSDEQWSRIAPLLPNDVRGMKRVDDRRVLSGIVHALQSGGRWGDCPEHFYGPKKTLYNRFKRWADRGVWERIFADLAGVDGVPSKLFIDSSCLKVHRTAGGGKGGLGSWYRHDQGRSQHQASLCLRREGAPTSSC